MTTFRTKIVVVQAVQFFPDQRPWPEGVVPAKLQHNRPQDRHYWPAGAPIVPSPAGSGEPDTLVSPGDWIVTEPGGDRIVVTDEGFRAGYEPVTP